MSQSLLINDAANHLSLTLAVIKDDRSSREPPLDYV
jgi:hypothetical protein